jgi:hypothetical protein
MLLTSHSVDSTNTSASSSLQCSYAETQPYETYEKHDNPYAEPVPVKSRRGRKPKNTTDATKKRIEETSGAETTEIHLQTFHFSFTEEIAEKFAYFATLHRFEDRKSFKENWTKWIQEEDIAELIEREKAILEQNGYVGDTIDKMFKSVRYYYRKKPMTPKEPKQRKPYVALPADILAKMDNHIIEVIVANTNPETKQCIISPAKAYEAYLKKEAEAKQNADEQVQQVQVQMDDADKDKYKKTYKNRFFIATQNVRAIA